MSRIGVLLQNSVPVFLIVMLISSMLSVLPAQESGRQRAREHGLRFGIFNTGELNAITDVPGVRVGHITLIEGSDIRTGVTAILPHSENLFQQKVPAAIHIANGFGKLAGYSQVKELGLLETPIILTNTLSVGAGINAVVKYTLAQAGNEDVRSVNALIGETNDGYLNDIRGMRLGEKDFIAAIERAADGMMEEGNVGAGTGTVCFGYKGGIGTSSRVLPRSIGGYTIGVLVQTNFGGDLIIEGSPIGRALGKYPYANHLSDNGDGSCMIVVMTDAPLDARNLERLGARAMLGMGRTGASMSNGSGDYVIAVSTHPAMRMPHDVNEYSSYSGVPLHNDQMSPLFLAVIEATEEAIINSLFVAETMIGRDGHKIEALPIEIVLPLLRR